MLINRENVDLKKYIYKIFKIIMLTSFWSCFTLVILFYFQGKLISISVFVKSLVVLKHDYTHHLGFLNTLIKVYIFYMLIFCCYKTDKKIFKFFSVVIFILAFSNKFIGMSLNLVALILGKYTYLNFYIDYLFRYSIFSRNTVLALAYFILGMIAYNYVNKIKSLKFNFILLGWVTLFLSMLFLTLYGILRSNNDLTYDIVYSEYDNIFTLFMVIAIFLITLNYKGTSSFGEVIRCVSENTFGIYVIHWILIEVYKLYFDSKFIVYPIIIFFVSLLISKFFKKIPVFKYFFKV